LVKNKIRFIDTHYKLLFYIDDGDDIIIEVEGEPLQRKCVFIDEYHTEIGGYVYHICEFAEKMALCNQAFYPANLASILRRS
jgi:hypothetical protein